MAVSVTDIISTQLFKIFVMFVKILIAQFWVCILNFDNELFVISHL